MPSRTHINAYSDTAIQRYSVIFLLRCTCKCMYRRHRHISIDIRFHNKILPKELSVGNWVDGQTRTNRVHAAEIKQARNPFFSIEDNWHTELTETENRKTAIYASDSRIKIDLGVAIDSMCKSTISRIFSHRSLSRDDITSPICWIVVHDVIESVLLVKRKTDCIMNIIRIAHRSIWTQQRTHWAHYKSEWTWAFHSLCLLQSPEKSFWFSFASSAKCHHLLSTFTGKEVKNMVKLLKQTHRKRFSK